MISADDLSLSELAALMHFHADAGVEWLLHDEAVDRFAEFELLQAARRAPTPATARTDAALPITAPGPRLTAAASERAAPERPVRVATVAIPDDQAIAEARAAADGAATFEALRLAIEGFSGCNLKNSARCTVFASGEASSGIMIIGPMPNADDDRDGQPFSGRIGELLDRMLAAIGTDRTKVLLTNAIPWRPPGNRMPSPAEIEICRPFIERQILLANPKAILVLGNLTARFFFAGNETIHMMRGQWRDITIGDRSIPALASLHPQELLTAPINKRLAWNDLQLLQAQVAAATSA